MDYHADPRANELGERGAVTPTAPDFEDSKTETCKLPSGARVVCTTPDLVKQKDGTRIQGTWLGTNGFGVYWLEKDTHCYKPAITEGLTSEVIRTIREFPSEDDLVWVGTDMGLNLCRESGMGRLIVVTRWTRAEGLPGEEITALARDMQKGIWIGTRSGLAEVPSFDSSPYIMNTFTTEKGLPADHVTALKVATVNVIDTGRASGAVWVGTVGGVAAFDFGTRTFSPALTAAGQTLTDSWVREIDVKPVEIVGSATHKSTIVEKYTVSTRTLASNRDGQQTFDQTLEVEASKGTQGKLWEQTTIDPILEPVLVRNLHAKQINRVRSVGWAHGALLLGLDGGGILVDGRAGSLWMTACADRLGQPSEGNPMHLSAPLFEKQSLVPALSAANGAPSTAAILDMPVDQSLANPVFPNRPGAHTPWPAHSGPRLPQDSGEQEAPQPVRLIDGPRLPLPDGQIRSLLTDPSGTLWIATRLGVTRVTAGGLPPRVDPTHGPVREVVGNDVSAMTWDTWRGHMRIPTDDVRKLAYDPRRAILWAIGLKSDEGFTDAKKGHLALSRAPDVLMRCERDVWTRIPLEAGDSTGAATEGIHIHNLAVSPLDGRVFLATDRGLLVCDGARVSRYQFSPTVLNPDAWDGFKVKPDQIGSIEALCVAQDPRGTLWVGTHQGLIRDNGRALKIYSTSNHLMNNDVTWVYATRSEVYIHSRRAMAMDDACVQRLVFDPVWWDVTPRQLQRVDEYLSRGLIRLRTANVSNGMLLLYRPRSEELGSTNEGVFGVTGGTP